MKISEDNQYLSQWNKYEVARYVKSLDRVIRDKHNSMPLIVEHSSLDQYAKKHGNVGIYTSVFAYNNEQLDKATRLGPLYFDLDSDDINLAFNECKAMYGYLAQFLPKTSILVYFTGKKGFHIECEPVTLGISPSNELPKIYRYIANDLKNKIELQTIDFSVYDQRRMWRYPNSIHQSTGLFKVLLNPNGQINFVQKTIEDILAYAQEPQTLETSDQSFDYKANEWYRQYTYDMEESKKRKDNPLEYFNKHGSKAFKNVSSTKKIFNKNKLLNNCPAVKKLEQQAKETGFLEHEARLFLCSILTYTEDSIIYLHEILSSCNDYNFEKSSAHINDWIQRRTMGTGGRPFTCDRANSVGVGCGSCELERKNKWVQIGSRYVETEEKISPSPIRFAYDSLSEKEKNGN